MRYAIIENEICVNIVVSDAAFAAQMGFVELPDEFGIGDRFLDGVWEKA